MKKYNFFKLEIIMLLLLIIIMILQDASLIFVPILILISVIAFFISLYKYDKNIDIDIEESENDTEKEKEYFNKKVENLCSIYIWKILASVSIIQFIVSSTRCACGYHYINIFPSYIFAAVDVIIYFFIIKKSLKKDIRKADSSILVFWGILSTIIYIYLVLFCRNDMHELHKVL